MTLSDVPIDQILLDPATEVRVPVVTESVVRDYADLMRDGVVFPPLVLFYDAATTVMRLADGRHRLAAHQRVGHTTVAAQVYMGTQADALWYAAQANREHGHRMTEADKSCCVARLLVAWPAKLQTEIAAHVGCSPSLVSKIYKRVTKNTGGVPDLRGRALRYQEKRARVRALLEAGVPSTEIRRLHHLHSTLIAEVRREVEGVRDPSFRTKRAINARIEKVRTMAADGYTTRQIAATVKLGRERVKDIAKTHGIDIGADRVVGLTHKHDSNRIVERTVMDAENLTAATELIKFEELDPTRVASWIASLKQSREQLSAFIRRLMQEQSHEAAEPVSA
jgi:hypothetical protein